MLALRTSESDLATSWQQFVRPDPSPRPKPLVTRLARPLAMFSLLVTQFYDIALIALHKSQICAGPKAFKHNCTEPRFHIFYGNYP